MQWNDVYVGDMTHEQERELEEARMAAVAWMPQWDDADEQEDDDELWR